MRLPGKDNRLLLGSYVLQGDTQSRFLDSEIVGLGRRSGHAIDLCDDRDPALLQHYTVLDTRQLVEGRQARSGPFSQADGAKANSLRVEVGSGEPSPHR